MLKSYSISHKNLVKKWAILLVSVDVQTAFLNGELKEDIYMEIPDGFECLKADKTKQVLKLKKSIYGLKQSSRVWNLTFTATIKSM